MGMAAAAIMHRCWTISVRNCPFVFCDFVKGTRWGVPFCVCGPHLMIQQPSLTEQMSLDSLSARLAANDVAAGVVWIGSTGSEQQTAHSDYDILLFMRQMPVPLHVVFTTVAGVLTDVIFSNLSVVDRVLTGDDLSELTTRDGNVMFWLTHGRIFHDADGRVQQAQSRLQTESWTTAVNPGEMYQTWHKVNYNWRQTRRMLAAEDVVYDTAVDLRLLYMLSELTVGYFTVRNMHWDGDKSAVRCWQAHDPPFLALFQQCLVEADRRQKFALYEQLAQLTLAPVGGLGSEPTTSIALSGEWSMDDVETDGGYRLIVNGGAYQDVPQLHFHLISDGAEPGNS